jgi:hypothetical protein
MRREGRRNRRENEGKWRGKEGINKREREKEQMYEDERMKGDGEDIKESMKEGKGERKI